MEMNKSVYHSGIYVEMGAGKLRESTTKNASTELSLPRSVHEDKQNIKVLSERKFIVINYLQNRIYQTGGLCLSKYLYC